MSGMAIHWDMTINNYDATDVALVQQGYPDHIRQLVYSFEIGEKCGTPHIQAYIKLKRQERLSYVKKLFPRGSFKMITSDYYVLNAQRYAQKLDKTANGKATITNYEPIHTLESVIKRMVVKMIDDETLQDTDLDICKTIVEKQMVKEDYRYAKIFVSATYKQMWKQFGHEMYENIFHTHTTHTHAQEKISREGGITQDASEDRNSRTDAEDTEGGSEVQQEEGEDYETDSGSTDEGYDEGADYESDETDNCEEY